MLWHPSSRLIRIRPYEALFPARGFPVRTLACRLASVHALEPIPEKLVVLTFDDSVASHYTTVRPLLKKYGFSATFFITEGFSFRTNKADYMTWEQIAALHHDGFEIGNHTRDHLGVSADTLGRLEEQIDAIQQRCAEHGIPRPASFAYPGNAIHPGGLPILARLGFKFARRGGEPEHPYADGRGTAFEPGRDHPLLLPTAGDGRPAWTLDDFKRAAQQAVGGKIAILQFHGVPDREHPWVHTPPEQFQQYLEYLANNGYQVVALRDLARFVDPQLSPADPLAVIQERKANPASATHVTGSVLDSSTGRPIPCRLYIQSSNRQWFFADSLSSNGSARIYSKRSFWNSNAVEMHTTLSADPFELRLPAGEYTFTLEHGKDYLPLTNQVSVSGESLELKFGLKRWINLAARGWFSGDTHVHRHPSDIPNLLLAEDLNVTHPMTYWTTVSTVSPAQSPQRMAGAFGEQPVVVDSKHVWYPRNTEYEIFRVGERSHTLGAFLLINHRRVFELPAPPLAQIVQQARREGALIDLEKHNWPWSILLMPLMRPDLYELANNHNWRTEFSITNWGVPAAPWMDLSGSLSIENERDWVIYGWRTYYALLNSGFRLQPTAGTAHGVHPVPMGYSRVYVHLPQGFSYDAWMRELNGGRSFVTTGPMVFARLEGFGPGEVLRRSISNKLEFRIDGEVLSQEPRLAVEVVVNGTILSTDVPTMRPRPEGGYSGKLAEVVELDQTSWVAVRCFEHRDNGRFRFAHTAPWWIEFKGRPLVPKKEEVNWFVRRVEDELARNRGVVPAAAFSEFEQALAAWREIEKRAQ